ncbi:Cys/Met metabolism PLP-dependent enzyme-domain-containing protein [Pisolithus orientalis]|uniref:Cys/Met metabolism PLP-dependent enzyme-domain-containing protein n=1 Tax=Pisolithus orientalis TaxID=936130 RepID=UPI00222567A7|nr:Cys/Met metabolism PLP-dependent enzyme-domain-containing protein [Pisolithus orientalis]KAI6025599.1 Cys/Met metabolism PLP-dependent enzyme-domain-containing protein [Pisolithus orientalis]
MTSKLPFEIATTSVGDLPTPEPDSPYRPRRPYRFSTLCATVENPGLKDQYGSSSVPIYQTATFKGIGGEYDYSRSGNPTRSHLEHHIAKISSAAHGFAVSSGMAALDTILRLLKPGDAIVAGDDLYGGTNRLLAYLRTHAGITVHHADTTKPDTLIPLLKTENNVAMVLLESPTNPLLKIVDIATIAKEVKERVPAALVVVDNTMMSPFLQRPLEHGADIVYDSATKYLSGHHDLMAGIITCNRDDVAKQIAFIINATGNGLTPFDSFLLLRGSKTLAIRLNQQSSTSMLVARYLHSLGFPTFYPGLPDHPNREMHERISSGYGAVLSFATGSRDISERIVAATRLWSVSVSFGCVNSLISMPCAMSHASIPPATRAARGLPEDLIRLCVGIEDSADLLDDLERALIDAGAIRRTAAGLVRVQTSIGEAVQKLAEKEAAKDEIPPHEKPWVVSAPGKVILFGEHAVVYGVPALAASLSLRCYAISTPRADDTLGVHFLDIDVGQPDGFKYEWDLSELPWDAVPSQPSSGEGEVALNHQFLDTITSQVLTDISNAHARQASLAFLYLYMVLAAHSGQRPALTLAARATLPVGAGLGSSASFSVCTSTSLLFVFGRIRVPSQSLPVTPSTSSASSSSSAPTSKLPDTLAQCVNRYAFLLEKILHGTPSGVDNSVAVFGGGLQYTKGQGGGLEAIDGFKALRFLLTDTRVPRNTRSLVAGVAERLAKDPNGVGAILEQIREVVGRARRTLGEEGDGTAVLADLIDENHAHLVDLGVSHPSLEDVRDVTRTYGLATKLTGAGGGGCAVTLVPDDFSESSLSSVITTLREKGYVPYLTQVGGPGLGVLVSQGSFALPMTPPEPPACGIENSDGLSEGALTGLFAQQSKPELGSWIDSLGNWAFV